MVIAFAFKHGLVQSVGPVRCFRHDLHSSQQKRGGGGGDKRRSTAQHSRPNLRRNCFSFSTGRQNLNSQTLWSLSERLLLTSAQPRIFVVVVLLPNVVFEVQSSFVYPPRSKIATTSILMNRLPARWRKDAWHLGSHEMVFFFFFFFACEQCAEVKLPHCSFYLLAVPLRLFCFQFLDFSKGWTIVHWSSTTRICPLGMGRQLKGKPTLEEPKEKVPVTKLLIQIKNLCHTCMSAICSCCILRSASACWRFSSSAFSWNNSQDFEVPNPNTYTPVFFFFEKVPELLHVPAFLTFTRFGLLCTCWGAFCAKGHLIAKICNLSQW